MSKNFKIISAVLLLAIGALVAGLIVLDRIDPKQKAARKSPPQTAGKEADKAPPPLAAAKPVSGARRYEVGGSLPPEFGPATQVERAQIKWYCITNSMDDVGEKRQTDEIKINPDGTFAAGFSPQDKFRGTIRVELLVTSKTFVPLMGRAESRPNQPAKIIFVPPLAVTNAVHVKGVCVDAEDGSPVPLAGIYLNANKVLTARADEQGRFECDLPSARGRASFVPWLRKYAGQYVSFTAEPGDTREVRVRMKKNQAQPPSPGANPTPISSTNSLNGR